MKLSSRSRLSPRALLLGLSFLLLPSALLAGPNEGGVLIVHLSDAVYTPDDTEYCGESGLQFCETAITRTDDATTGVVLSVLAAFPGDTAPRLAGVTLGVDYDTGEIGILDDGSCGDFQLSTGGWPGPGEGTAITWSSAQTDHLIETCWFAAYSYYGNPTSFATIDHPTGGANFADDDVPAMIDPVEDFGSLGFNTDGNLPCPEPPPVASVLSLSPSEITVYQPCASTFEIDLMIADIYSAAAFEVCLGFDSQFLQVDDVVIDPTFLGSTGRDVVALTPVPCTPSCQADGIRFGAYTFGTEDAPFGSGRLASIVLSPQGAGSGTEALCLDDPEFINDRTPPGLIVLDEVHGLSVTHSAFCYGDFTTDGDVTVFDLARNIPKWRTCSGDAGYEAVYDVNLLERFRYCASTPDGCVDVVDIQSVAGRWRLGCPGDGSGRPVTESPEAEVGADVASRSSGPTLRFDPDDHVILGTAGDLATVDILIEGALDLGGFETGLSFDPAVARFVDVGFMGILENNGRTYYGFAPEVDNVAGIVHFGVCTVGEGPGADGDGVLATVTFELLECETETALDLHDVIVVSKDGWPQELGGTTGGVLGLTCVSDVEDSPLRSKLTLLPPRPNPASSNAELVFHLPNEDGRQPVRLDVFSVGGRQLQTLLDEEVEPGVHRVLWDGRDGFGQRLPSGTYFCRLDVNGTVLHQQVQLVR